MNHLRRLLRFSPAQLLQLSSMSALLIAAEISVRLWSLRTILRVLEQRRARARRASPLLTEDLGQFARFIELADRHGPWQPSCLRQALVLEWLLSGRGIVTAFRIGVAQEAGQLRAHAWLDVLGAPSMSVFADPTYVVLSQASGSGTLT